MPHLQVIDGGAWDEIASHQPGLLGIPVVGLLRRPPEFGASTSSCRKPQEEQKYDCFAHKPCRQSPKPQHNITFLDSAIESANRPVFPSARDNVCRAKIRALSRS